MFCVLILGLGCRGGTAAQSGTGGAGGGIGGAGPAQTGGAGAAQTGGAGGNPARPDAAASTGGASPDGGAGGAASGGSGGPGFDAGGIDTAGPDGPTPLSSPRTDVNIDDGWRFIRMDVTGAEAPAFVDTAWMAVTLPHTWNAADGQDGGGYYRGIGWYRRHVNVPAAYAGRSVYIQFDAASLVADVYVNGTLAGQHRGGFAAFRFDLTALLHAGDNVVAVRVSNAAFPDVPPLSGDFTFFGGLYRDVHLVVVDKVRVDLDDLGSPGVFLTPSSVSATSANLRVLVKLKNADVAEHAVDVQATVMDAGGRPVANANVSRTLAAGAADTATLDLTLASPHLWNGRADPYLYAVDVSVGVAGELRDLVRQPLGFRSFALDPNTGFSLNGQHLDLHGVNRHQDRIGKGWAISSADQDADMALVMELGATAIRLAHYQHAQYFYDLSDRNGLVVWTELAMVNSVANTPAFTANARQQLTELIRQSYNHPAIAFWGIGNEVLDVPVDPNPLLMALHDLARTEDPSRLTTFAANLGDNNAVNWHTDTVGFNKYYGWYYGTRADLGPWADNIHRTYPTRSIGISEVGAGASINLHAESPAPAIPVAADQHTEEYQALFHESSWAALQARPFIWGKFVWSMFDFASDGRNEGDTPGRNDKGLVTFDRVTRKDAFFFYKANWSNQPFVYIASRRFTPRTTATTSVKVYSNAATVTLAVNGSALPAVTSANHVFVWPNVGLAVGGMNHLTASATVGGTAVTDSVDWARTGP
jgi:beta-galactosidase